MWQLCFVSNIKYANDSLILEFSKQTNSNVVDEELLCQDNFSKEGSKQSVPSYSKYNNISICVDDGLDFLPTHSKHY